MIFIWACIFARAPKCSLFLITDHVAYIIAVVAVENIYVNCSIYIVELQA